MVLRALGERVHAGLVYGAPFAGSQGGARPSPTNRRVEDTTPRDARGAVSTSTRARSRVDARPRDRETETWTAPREHTARRARGGVPTRFRTLSGAHQRKSAKPVDEQTFAFGFAPSLLGGSEAGAAPRRVPARATVRDSSHDVVLSRARSASPAMSGVGMKREHAQMASGAPLERARSAPAVDAGAGTVALPRRPDFGREGRPIGALCEPLPHKVRQDAGAHAVRRHHHPRPPRGPPGADQVREGGGAEAAAEAVSVRSPNPRRPLARRFRLCPPRATNSALAR